MAVVVHYCDKCGIRIEPEDIQEEKALLLGDKAFCPSCAQKVMAAEPQPAEEAKPEKSASKRKQPVRAAPPRKKTTASIARRPRREKRVDEYEQPEEKPEGPPLPKKKSPVPIILGVCGVLIIIVIIAIAASGGGKTQTEKPEISEKPGGPPVSGPGPDKVVEGPVGPVEGPVEESKGMKRLEQAIDYGRSHPEDYAKVADMLDAIMREESLTSAQFGRVQRAYDDWKVRWETAAEAQWKKTTADAEELAGKGENEKAAKLWDNFPEKYRKLDTYDQDAAAEAKKLRDQQVALEALKEIEGDLAAAEKEYTLETLEEAEGVLKRLGEFGRKHEDIKPLVERILPVYNSLKEKVEKIWKEKEAKEMEEWLKDQNEKREEEARQREQQGQQRWAALKALWQKTYANYDQGAAQSLPLGNYTIYDGSSNKGWIIMTGQDENVTWSFAGTISGTNNGAKGSVLATHYKQAYLWENYTFTAKVRVVKGTCFIGVRANINEQNQISATRFLPGTGADWVDVKVEVNGSTATSFVNGKQTGSLGTDYPAGYPAIFLQPNSQVEVKEITIDLKSTKN